VQVKPTDMDSTITDPYCPEKKGKGGTPTLHLFRGGAGKKEKGGRVQSTPVSFLLLVKWRGGGKEGRDGTLVRPLQSGTRKGKGKKGGSLLLCDWAQWPLGRKGGKGGKKGREGRAPIFAGPKG